MNEVTRIGQAGAGTQESVPHNVEAEQQLLGAILTNNDVFDRIAALVSATDFHDPVHGRIFEVAKSRISRNTLASPVTLKAFLEDDPGLRELGGPAYLARLAGSAISPFAARDYAQMIRDLSIRRDLMQIGRDITEKAASVDVATEPAEQISEAEQALYEVAGSGRSSAGFRSFLTTLTAAVDVAAAAYRRDGGLAGLSTGFADLDRRIGGLHRSELVWSSSSSMTRASMTAWPSCRLPCQRKPLIWRRSLASCPATSSL